MLTKIPKLRYLCSSTQTITNLAFNTLKDPTKFQQLNSKVTHNKQKLDALTNVILSLTNLQVQYFNQLQNEKVLKNGGKIVDNMIFSLGTDKKSVIQYLYQKRWMKQVWKDYHILTSLYSDEGDKQGVQQAAEVIKQIYQFELTSVDPAQKIKVIKVIRQLLGLGLKQAKDIVDKAPIIMKKGKKDQGQKLKEQLTKSGCVVTIK